jgi:hypothetical protein
MKLNKLKVVGKYAVKLSNVAISADAVFKKASAAKRKSRLSETDFKTINKQLELALYLFDNLKKDIELQLKNNLSRQGVAPFIISKKQEIEKAGVKIEQTDSAFYLSGKDDTKIIDFHCKVAEDICRCAIEIGEILDKTLSGLYRRKISPETLHAIFQETRFVAKLSHKIISCAEKLLPQL